MDAWQVEAIDKHYHRLIGEIPTRRIMDLLQYDGIISESTIKTILKLRGIMRNVALLNLIIDTGPGAYACFLHALTISGQKDLVDLLIGDNAF